MYAYVSVTGSLFKTLPGPLSVLPDESFVYITQLNN